MKVDQNPYLQQLHQLIKNHIGDLKVKVYLFGSRAKGKQRITSDVDLAFLPLGKLPVNFFTELRELLEESNLPYRVDIVDLSQTDQTFREKILREGILWND